LYWFYQDLKERFSSGDDDFRFDDNDDWLAWCSWLAPITGHQGVVPDEYKKDSREYKLSISVPANLLAHLKQSRQQWLKALEQLFLEPAGLSLNDTPPLLATSKNKQSATTMLAGFCSVSNWLGSSELFTYDDQPCDDLTHWYECRLEIAKKALKEAGVFGQIRPNQTFDALLNSHSPVQMQCLVRVWGTHK
jgi:CRISPR-associated endonuclease/helicase Cas3